MQAQEAHIEIAAVDSAAKVIVIHNGFLVDADTGEVLGLASTPERFDVTDLASAEWVLNKMSECDAEEMGIEARIKAVTENLNSDLRQTRGRREYLMGRFGEGLKAFAHFDQGLGKRRTTSTAFGKLSFRTTPESIEIVDMALAVEWAKTNAPDAVKTVESVLKTPLKGIPNLPEDAFTLVPAGETFKVETGVRK
jgi:hypothetical protein